MPTKDVEKQRRYRREWYVRNKKRQVAYKLVRNQRIRDWLRDYKKTLKCNRCPESDYVVLEFHHLDPTTKDLSIYLAVESGWSISRLEREIAKCEVLCSNCHKKHHWQERWAVIV